METLKDLPIEDADKAKLQTEIDSTIEAKVQERLDQEVSGLKSKNDELLAEKKAIQKAKEQADAKARDDKEKQAQENGQYKELYESQKAENESINLRLNEMMESQQRQTIRTEASRIAGTLTKDVQKAKLLEKEISQRLTLVENEIRVTDDSGQLTVSSLDDLSAKIKTEYSFLVDGIQAQGGGATRSIGGASVEVQEMSRSQFDELSQKDRAIFVRGKGKIVNE
jgi:multidrug efflux pump subunit AcrA (membrane-fusion protein)